MPSIPVVTIDGPSGSGKGTVGRLLAAKLGWHFLDSGALYRAVAFSVMQQAISLQHTEKLVQAAQSLDLQFTYKDGNLHIYMAGTDVTAAIRNPRCSEVASKISAIEQVRVALLDKQHAFQQPPGLVADGRDMGTVVFPQASKKFFLTADIEERARRRWQQLQEKGEHVNLDAILAQLQVRDQRDHSRSVAPLKPAENAIVIDTTHLSIVSVLEKMLAQIEVK